MPFPSRLVYDGETVVLDLRPHWWYFSRHIVTGVPLLILVVVTFQIPDAGIYNVVKWPVVIELVVIYTDDQHFRIGPASDQNTVHCEIVFRKSVKHSSVEKPLVSSAIKLLRQQTHAAARSKD